VHTRSTALLSFRTRANSSVTALLLRGFMAIDTSRVQENIQKLVKALKKIGKTCTPDEVHKLRTRAKSFEASTEAFSVTSKRRSRRILRALKRIRRKAGDVRDMDVLTSHLSTVRTNGEQDCLVQLFEHLGAARYKQAARLRSLAKEFGPEVRKQLKTVAKRLDQRNAKPSGANRKQASTEAAGFALRISGDLARPAMLNRSNLHDYRLKIKELEDVLKMADSDAAEDFVEALDECKDAIGEWHDWEELIARADHVLDHGRNCKLTRQLRKISAGKLDQALSMTNKLRRTYVGRADRTGKQGSSGHAQPKQSVLKAVSAISTNENKKSTA